VAADARPRHTALVELLRRDLANSQTMSVASNGHSIVLIGHGGIDPRSLSLTGRLTQVTYEVRQDRGTSVLVRRQQYLDDPIHRDVWSDAVSPGATGILVEREGRDTSTGEDIAPESPEEASPDPADKLHHAASAVRIPSKIRLRVAWLDGSSLNELVWLR
jgi:hypothetical protein